MKVATKIFELDFSDEDSKKAYLKLCKWMATNIISKVEIGEVIWSVTKVKNADLPTFKLELFVMLDANDFDKDFCNHCKSIQDTFYKTQRYSCNECKYVAFKNQMKERLDVKKSYRKTQITRENEM